MGAPLNATTNWVGTETSRLPSTTPAEGNRPKSRKGFASMDPVKQREIAAAGGRAAHRNGNAHEFTSEEARAAGKKRHAKNRATNLSSGL
jgi:general stress protein YciG